jgi:hypothetical protein
LTGVAVNVTPAPWQIVEEGDADMDTEAVEGVLLVTVTWLDVRKQGLFSEAGRERVQFMIEPVSTAARSYTISVHVPLGLTVPPPIAANVASVDVLHEENAPDGLYVFVNGAPVAVEGTVESPSL